MADHLRRGGLPLEEGPTRQASACLACHEVPEPLYLSWLASVCSQVRRSGCNDQATLGSLVKGGKYCEQVTGRPRSRLARAWFQLSSRSLLPFWRVTAHGC